MVYLYDRRRISSLYRFVWMLLIAFNVLACEETELFEEIAAQKPESSSMKILAGDVPTSEITSKPEDVLIRHPLKNVKLINGKVPAIDIKNSPNTNKRFAYGGQTFQLSENGPVVNKSGVIELERHQITEVSEKTSQVPSLHTQLQITQGRSKIRPKLQEIAENSASKDVIEVRIRVLDDYATEHVAHVLERQIGLGTIETKADMQLARERAMASRRTHFAILRQPIESKLDDWAVTYRALPNLLFIHARIQASRLSELAAIPQVHSISVSHEGRDQSGSECPIPTNWLDSWVNGEEVVQGTQIQQFLCNGFDAQPSGGPYRAAVIEKGVSHNNYGKLDYSGGPSRWIARRGCGFFYCDAAGNEDKTQHASATTGLIAGDLTQEQDPNYLNEQTQVAYSGYAPETEIYSFALENGSASFETAVDDLLEYSKAPLITNISWGLSSDTSFFDCIGDWDEDEALNSIYEAGILPIKSAGNDGHSGTNCKVSIPGSAIGSFTVGGHNSQSGISDVRNGNIYYNSSRGGYIYNGGQRSIIDLTAPAHRRNMASTGMSDWTWYTQGTSFSAPTVSAAALNFADFYETTYSSWILNPGALTVNLLLMGDREAEVGSLKTSRFDNLWGAGRMHMRMFNNAGLDAPWSYGRYSVCVDNGETVSFTLNSISSDVDTFNVVAYWYDRRHDFNGTTMDDIDLQVQLLNSNNLTLGSRSSISGVDEKERVYFNMKSYPLTDKIEIKLKGHNVTADNEGCGLWHEFELCIYRMAL